MRTRPGTVERAFELARDSQLLTVEKIRRRLKAEGYIDWELQLSGREIRRQLQALVVAKRKRVADAAEGRIDPERVQAAADIASQPAHKRTSSE